MLASLLLLTTLQASLAGSTGPRVESPADVSPWSAYIENRGQWPEDVQFVGRWAGVEVQIRDDGVWLVTWSRDGDSALAGDAVRLTLRGADDLRATGRSRAAGTWGFARTAVRESAIDARGFASVELVDALPGLDWIWLVDDQGRARFDFRVDSTVELRSLDIVIDGGAASVDTDGSLRILASRGAFSLSTPIAFDDSGAVQAAHWLAAGDSSVEINVPGRIPGERLTIDPSIVYSTFVGAGEADLIRSVDMVGDEVAVAGLTQSPTFPTTPGALDGDLATQGWDAFCVRFTTDPVELKFSTFLGDSVPFSEKNAPIARIHEGDTVVAFQSGSGHPTTPGAYVTPIGGARDLLITRLNATGTEAVFTARLGGSNWETAFELLVEDDGRVIVAGSGSSDFPVHIAIQGGPQLTGTSGFLAEIHSSGDSLLRSVAINGGFSSTTIYDFALEVDGSLVIGGEIQSGSLPTTKNAFQPSAQEPVFSNVSDGYWMRLDPTWTEIEYASFLSSPFADYLWQIEPVGTDAFWLVFNAATSDIPFPPTVDLAELAPGVRPWLFMLWDSSADEVLQARWVTSQDLRATSIDHDGGIVMVSSTIPDSQFPFLNPGEPFGPPGQLTVAKLDPLGERWVQAHAFGGLSSEATYAFDASIASPDRLIVGGQTSSQALPVDPDAIDPSMAAQDVADGFVTVFDLTPSGVVRYGSPIGVCNGECRVGLRALPTAGESDFGLACVGAPRSTPGALVVGLGPSDLPLASGGTLLVDPVGALVLPTSSDPIGRAGVDLPLTTVPAGVTVHFQFVWLDLGACGDLGATYSSDALAVTTQP